MTLRREERLAGIDQRLADVVRRAARYVEFELLVVEGLRTLERQKQLVAKGDSKHLKGRAVDLAPVLDGEVRWDWPLFPVIHAAMQRAADELGVAITWGGHWRTFRDGPHWELK